MVGGLLGFILHRLIGVRFREVRPVKHAQSSSSCDAMPPVQNFASACRQREKESVTQLCCSTCAACFWGRRNSPFEGSIVVSYFCSTPMFRFVAIPRASTGLSLMTKPKGRGALFLCAKRLLFEALRSGMGPPPLGHRQFLMPGEWSL